MIENIDLSEYFEKWAKPDTPYPLWRIEIVEDILSKALIKHPNFSKLSFLAYGSQRNATASSPIEPLDIYVILDKDLKKNELDSVDTREYKKSIYNILKNYKTNSYETDDMPYKIIFKNNEDINISICPCYLYKSYIDDNLFVESVIFTISDKKNIINYPLSDNKNFDKKLNECGENFIFLIKIFKHFFLWVSKEIKYMNEIPPYFVEALVWNLPNEYFLFKRYEDAVIKSIDYMYEMIAQKDYMKIFEINDIKALFSSKNNINHEHVLKALYEIRNYIHAQL